MNFDLNGYLAAPIPYTDLNPVGSINGLICTWQHGVKVDNVYICNPITREYLTLPRGQNYIDHYGRIHYKFGLNSLTGEYKVLRIFPGRLLDMLEAEVYTLGTSQWRSLGQVPYRFVLGCRGPFLNGYFHWRVSHQFFSETICTFDLDKETFQLFPSPPTEHEDMGGWSGTFGVFKGCLCKSYTYNSQTTIWVMKQYAVKESWHKELVIKRPLCGFRDWLMSYDMYVFGGLQDGSILVVLGDEVLAYCPKSETIEDLGVLSRGLSLPTHRPSFVKLQDIDSERVHMF